MLNSQLVSRERCSIRFQSSSVMRRSTIPDSKMQAKINEEGRKHVTELYCKWSPKLMLKQTGAFKIRKTRFNTQKLSNLLKLRFSNPLENSGTLRREHCFTFKLGLTSGNLGPSNSSKIYSRTNGAPKKRIQLVNFLSLDPKQTLNCSTQYWLLGWSWGRLILYWKVWQYDRTT
jgi:hypothetical protein